MNIEATSSKFPMLRSYTEDETKSKQEKIEVPTIQP